jgi:hypothetical protein
MIHFPTFVKFTKSSRTSSEKPDAFVGNAGTFGALGTLVIVGGGGDTIASASVDFGAPHWGQAIAAVLICFPQS